MSAQHTQETICQLAELDIAARNHEKMAEMLEGKGKHCLASSARLDAYERRLARDYLDHNPNHGLTAALDYGSMRRKAGV